MTESTVLSIVHNHPGIRPGGAEGYAAELHRAISRHPGWRSVLLARGGPPLGRSGRFHLSTMVAPVDGREDEYLLFNDGYTFDWFKGAVTDKDWLTRHVRRYLQALQPDVVHVQHTMHLGYDLLREIRTTLPDTPIVHTLHEFAAMCLRDGQMMRTHDEGLCSAATPRACHECFPEHSPRDFFLRERFVKANFAAVDQFISPSRFLRDRYIDWGIDPERIIYEENGRTSPARVAGIDDRPTRDRLGFFGQFSRYKGLDVLLQAMGLLDPTVEDGVSVSVRRTTRPKDAAAAEIASVLEAVLGRPSSPTNDDGPHLWVHGANLDLQVGSYRDRLADLLDRTGDRVTMVGRYLPDDLPDLMEGIDWVVVPSVWWENAPLVIQEAFAHGRPVICSDIGGMAEKVTDGVNGLHFRAGDPRSLARVLHRATTESGLWERLREGIPEVHPMDVHVDRLVQLYTDLMGREQLPHRGTPANPTIGSAVAS